MRDDPFTRRTEDPEKPTMNTPNNWPLAIAMSIAAALLAFVSAEKLQPKRDRYQLEQSTPGIVARLDTRTGSVVFLGPTGKVLGEFPAGADAYAGIATPAEN